VVREHDFEAEGLNSINYTVVSAKKKQLEGVKFFHLKVDF
jgi:hypothetical protein